jgi:peptidoglycan/LPS O-acetylase OafA/YrhL
LTRLARAGSDRGGRGPAIGTHDERDLGNGRARSAPRLEYLDGLRGAAAFYVVLFHAAAGFTKPELPFWARAFRHLLTFGHSAVAVFIVLSGYCLMLPAARNDGRLTRGFGDYIGRRAWRILPPYYATVLASLALLWAVPELGVPSDTIWDESVPAFEWGPIVTHALLVHNFFPEWIYRINGPLWSVATEWHIYFFFPLLLLPVWRRAGAVATVIIAFAVGCAPLWLVPTVAAKYIPWYLGLFALGMCAAGVGFSTRQVEVRWKERVPWRISFVVLAASCVLGVTVLIKFWFRFMPLSDTLVGATTAAALVHYSRHAVDEEATRPLFLRLLESRPMAELGRFSYSLYLTHLPIVALVHLAVRRMSLAPATQMLVMIALSVPASLLAAYGFFLAFERRFLNRRPVPARVQPA